MKLGLRIIDPQTKQTACEFRQTNKQTKNKNKTKGTAVNHHHIRCWDQPTLQEELINTTYVPRTAYT